MPVLALVGLQAEAAVRFRDCRGALGTTFGFLVVTLVAFFRDGGSLFGAIGLGSFRVCKPCQ